MLLLTVLIAAAAGGGQTNIKYNANDLLATRLSTATNRLPHCLSRFLGYPPNLKKSNSPLENPFQLNPTFWLKDVDFTCVSPWNDASGCFRAGTAISKRHILMSAHYPLPNGTRISFVGDTGEVSHYRIVDAKTITGYDIRIGLLDYELTPDIHPAKILPSNFRNWIVEGSKWPVVTFNQKEQVGLSELVTYHVDRPEKFHFLNRTAVNKAWLPLKLEMVTGDSGNPAFLLYKGQPILLYCLLSGGAGHGPFVHDFRRQIQRLMDELCPGYALTDFQF